MSKIEKAHIKRIKELPCGLCGAPAPSDAHHIIQGRGGSRKTPDMTVIPLCKDCHQGSHNGIHHGKAMWRIMGKSELDILGETIKGLLYEN